MLNEENSQLKIDIIEQESVNKTLKKISEDLRKIPNIGDNYIDYISALIYAMYYSMQHLKNLLEIKDTKVIISIIDDALFQIREKENSKKLFININFSRTIHIDNYDLFKKVITELASLIIKLQETLKNSKAILAKAFENIITEAAQNNIIPYGNEEFYTSSGIIKTMVKLLDIKDGRSLYNPACGVGNFFIESVKYGKIYVFGEEPNISNFNICNTNLWLHDIYDKRIKEDSQEEFQLFDYVISNPPFVDNSDSYAEINKAIQDRYYFLLNASSYTKHLYMMLKNIRADGKIATIVPHGFLFKKTKAEYWVRRELVEKNYIDTVIGLPEKLFYNTKIPVVILLINKNKKKKEVLFIDASKDYESEKKNNILTKQHQNKIIDTYRKNQTEIGYSYVASLKEIIHNDYDLNIKRYIKIENKLEDINKNQLKEKIYNLENRKCEIENEIRKLIDDEKNVF